MRAKDTRALTTKMPSKHSAHGVRSSSLHDSTLSHSPQQHWLIRICTEFDPPVQISDIYRPGFPAVFQGFAACGSRCSFSIDHCSFPAVRAPFSCNERIHNPCIRLRYAQRYPAWHLPLRSGRCSIRSRRPLLRCRQPFLHLSIRQSWSAPFPLN